MESRNSHRFCQDLPSAPFFLGITPATRARARIQGCFRWRGKVRASWRWRRSTDRSSRPTRPSAQGRGKRRHRSIRSQKKGFLAVFGGYRCTRSGESGQSSTDCSDFHRCFYGFHSSARAEKSAAGNPKLPKFPLARGALSLPEGAERVSRAAATLCERPRSLPTRATAPAGPENQGAPTARRSCAPPGVGRCFWPDRWRRSRGSLADRLAIGWPAGPGRQCQFFRERDPNI